MIDQEIKSATLLVRNKFIIKYLVPCYSQDRHPLESQKHYFINLIEILLECPIVLGSDNFPQAITREAVTHLILTLPKLRPNSHQQLVSSQEKMEMIKFKQLERPNSSKE